MNKQTQVRNIIVRSGAEKRMYEAPKAIELEPRVNSWGTRLLQLDKLVRNLAVVGGIALVMIAVRSSSAPQAQSVFGAIRDSVGMEWDESLGKLSFVNAILPEEIRAVWNETANVSVVSPVDGDVIQAWSRTTPYILMTSEDGKVYACADGEVMNVAHGMDEELVIRVRHYDGTEAVYGNLAHCDLDAGESVSCGASIGTLLAQKPLAFEVRCDGRSVDPMHGLIRFTE